MELDSLMGEARRRWKSEYTLVSYEQLRGELHALENNNSKSE
jgi:hypothetical protein